MRLVGSIALAVPQLSVTHDLEVECVVKLMPQTCPVVVVVVLHPSEDGGASKDAAVFLIEGEFALLKKGPTGAEQ